MILPMLVLEGWTIVNTDNSKDLFLCGTETPSCLDVDETPWVIKCLLAYPQDGKNRLLGIKNKEGKTEVRSIIRVLVDKITEKNVLFLETIYPHLAENELKEALLKDALEFAQELKLPLLSRWVRTGIPYPNDIHSLSGKAPFEYVDALGGITNGTFVISGAHVLSDK